MLALLWDWPQVSKERAFANARPMRPRRRRICVPEDWHAGIARPSATVARRMTGTELAGRPRNGHRDAPAISHGVDTVRPLDRQPLRYCAPLVPYLGCDRDGGLTTLA